MKEVRGVIADTGYESLIAVFEDIKQIQEIKKAIVDNNLPVECNIGETYVHYDPASNTVSYSVKYEVKELNE